MDLIIQIYSVSLNFYLRNDLYTLLFDQREIKVLDTNGQLFVDSLGFTQS